MPDALQNDLVVMNLTVVCQSFPEKVSPEVKRDNIVKTITTIFEGETRIIFLEGVEGIGKTTLLSQFARKHPHSTFSLFIKFSNRWGSDPEIAKFDLSNQLQWCLSGEELKTHDYIPDSLLRRQFMELARKARQERKTYYFVVDGLDELPAEHSGVKNLIIELLPTNWPYFRFLVSGQQADYPTSVQNLPGKPYPLAGFSSDEAIRMLKDLIPEESKIEEVCHITQGIPGRLASVRRSIQGGIAPDDLISNISEHLPSLFELEWNESDSTNLQFNNLLAIVAHDQRPHTLADLALYVGGEPSILKEYVDKTGFLKHDKASDVVRYVSEAFKNFAANRMASAKDAAEETVINHLLKNSDGEDALFNLPNYLNNAGRLPELLNYLTPKHLNKMLELTQSWIPVQNKINLGLEVARQLKRDGDMVRFGIQKSAFSELTNADCWRSEVEACTALGNFGAALNLAHNTVVKEDRLHLLALIAKGSIQKGEKPSPELLEEMNQLYKEIDFSGLGERAVEIASDVIYSNPDMAIEMVEKGNASGAGAKSVDWALAQLSIAALQGKMDAEKDESTLDNIRSRIKDRGAKTLSSAAQLLLGDQSADKVLGEVENIGKAADQIYFLRQWALANKTDKNAAKVVKVALELIIKTTEYPPNATVFRELATPLPHLEPESGTKDIVSIFDGQKGAAEVAGPTDDYIRLQLLLAHCESKYDRPASESRIIDIYFYIGGLIDLSVKTASLARLASLLHKIDPECNLEKREGLHSIIKKDLEEYLHKLLSTTADHYAGTVIVIRSLAESDFEAAFTLANALNTQDRRDGALRDLFKACLRANKQQTDTLSLRRILDAIVDRDVWDEALLAALKVYMTAKELTPQQVDSVLILIKLTAQVRDAGERCRGLCMSYVIAKRSQDRIDSECVCRILDDLNNAWRHIDAGWHKVDVGFKICQMLAKDDVEVARKYFDLAEQTRTDVVIGAKDHAYTYIYCIKLAIRAYAGLLKKKLFNKEDTDALEQLINKIPAFGHRAKLWSEIALRHFLCGNISEGQSIVSHQLKSCLSKIDDADASYLDGVIAIVAPALYAAHKTSAFEYIERMAPGDRDLAFDNIALYILRKTVPSDPYDSFSDKGFLISFEDVLDLCGLIERMDTDNTIYSTIKHIADSVERRQKSNFFARNQIADICRRLNELVEKKLPNPRYITHDGYKIIAQAQIARIQRSNAEGWNTLIESANALPNSADQAYSLGIIASELPAKMTERSKKLFNDAIAIVRSVPVDSDRIEHYEYIARLAMTNDNVLTKECLKLAVADTQNSNASGMHELQKRLIDLAHRVDPALAASLASLCDDDPARTKGLPVAKSRVELLDIKKGMVDGANSDVDPKKATADQYAEAAWLALGSLNSGRAGTVVLEKTREFIMIASTLPMTEAYSIHAWIIENMVRRFAETDQSASVLRPVFDATLVTAKLSGALVTRATALNINIKAGSETTDTGQSLLVGVGDRSDGVKFLKEWVNTHDCSYIKLCDQYFGVDDLELIRVLLDLKPKCKIQILTSRKSQKIRDGGASLEDYYRNYWRCNVSDQDPYDVCIVVVGTRAKGDSPIHDRWWVTANAGLRMGTSINSLGYTKVSDISTLDSAEATERENLIDQYLSMSQREHLGERLEYAMFTL